MTARDDDRTALESLRKEYSVLLGHYITDVPDPLSEPYWSVIVRGRAALVDVSDIREQGRES